MKLVAIILSIIIFSLSALPCVDEGTIDVSQSTSISQDSNHSGQSDTDLCSPFCSCTCCASIAFEPNIQQHSLISEIHTTEINTAYIVSFTSNYLSLIYQPPQV